MPIAGFRHIGLKIISIALAALLWLVVAGEQVVERALRIPVELTNVPADLELVGDAPAVADVRVRGSSGILSRITAGELVAVLDLRDARPGPRLFTLAGSDVRAPFGVQVVQVTPSNVSITLERSATKIVPVVPEVDGEPAPGFIVGTISADPATVAVVGPSSALARMTTAITEPVSVEGVRASISEFVNVGAAIPSVRLREPQRVRVSVEVVPAPADWAVADIPLVVLNATRITEVTPDSVTLHVRGPRDLMRSGAGGFEAWIDVADLRAGQYELRVRVATPARVALVRVDPSEVRVRIR